MKIYTKRGDKGQTDVIGKRVKKSDVKMHIVGELDELAVRMADFLSVCENQTIIEDQKRIDSILFKIASIVIDINDKLGLIIEGTDTLFLEERINEMTEKLPPLKHFITYDGVIAAIKASALKTQVRKVERYMVEDTLDEGVLKFINRLSDYYFILSRYINYLNQFEETKRSL